MAERIAQAKLNYLRIAPRKVRRLANVLKGMSVEEAEAELLYRPQRAAKPLLKLLRSAVANALNQHLDKTRLYIADIRVDQGPMLKRWLPRAMGRATPIQKKSSHISLVLKEKTEPIIVKYKPPLAKLTKSEKVVSRQKIKKKEEEKPKVVEKKIKKPSENVFRRIFRRKEIA